MFETTTINYQDVLHVAENLREEDRQEITAGRGDDGDGPELADYIRRNATFGFVAKVDDEPAAVLLSGGCHPDLKAGIDPKRPFKFTEANVGYWIAKRPSKRFEIRRFGIMSNFNLHSRHLCVMRGFDNSSGPARRATLRLVS